MRRMIPFLRGLAILAVVANHSAGTGLGALFFWAHSLRDGAPPYLGEYGTLTYWVLATIRQLTLFSVPAFLFISGYFVAYAARGENATLSWKVVSTRITSLIWPYLIWSFVAYGLQLLLSLGLGWGESYSLGEFVLRLATGRVVEAYFFVPLLIQFYLLAPLIARFVKRRGTLTVLVALAIQLVVSGIWYSHMLGVDLHPGLRAVLEFDTALFVHWALFFPLGVACGFRASQIGQWLSQRKWLLLAGAVTLLALCMVETFALNYLQTDILGRSQQVWLADHGRKLSTLLYAVVSIFAVLAFKRRASRLVTTIEEVGSKSYGIYLIHPLVIQVISVGVYARLPRLASEQWILQPLLFGLAVGSSVLVMVLVNRFFGRRLYRYAFS